MDGTTVFLIVSVVAIFGAVVLMRWFKHREILAMVEKGLLPRQGLLPKQYTRYVRASRGRGGRGLLGWGVALAMLGLALIIGLLPVDGFSPLLLFGLIPLFIGLALLITYFVTRKEEATAPEAPSEEEAQVPSD